MIFNLGLILIFFLPIIESFSRQIAFNLLIAGSLLLGLSSIWKKKIKFDSLDLLWMGVLVVFTITTFYSWSFSKSYLELFRYIAYFLIFISVKNYTQPKLLLQKFFIPMLVFNSLALSLLFIISPIVKLPMPTNWMSLFYPVFLGHNHIADILLFAIPVVLFLPKKLISRLLSLVFILILFFSVSRGAMLSLVLAFFAYYFLTKRRDKTEEHIFSAWFIILTAITIIFLSSSFIYSNFIISTNNTNNKIKGFYKPAINENRIEYVIQAWNGFSKFPVFGTGLDTFRYISKIYQSESERWSWYAHNHFVQIFAETGLIGGILFLSLITILIFKAGITVYQPLTTNNQVSNGLFIAILASTIHSLIDFDWQFISVFLLYWVSLALINFQSSNQSNSRNNFISLFIYLFIFFMFIFTLIYQKNTSGLLLQDDQLTVGKNLQVAENILQKAYRLDKMDSDITWRLGNINSLNKNFGAAHLWYKKTILLDPLDSQDTIKNDLSLYLDEAKSALNKKDYQKGYNYLIQLSKLYPIYYQVAEGDYYLFKINKLILNGDKNQAMKIMKEYINILQNQIKRKKLSKEEILYIIYNFDKNVY